MKTNYKLGDKIKVNQRFVRKYSSYEFAKEFTKCQWELKDIQEVDAIVTGIRNISNGEMGKEGFYFIKSFKVLKVAINLKSEFYVPFKKYEFNNSLICPICGKKKVKTEKGFEHICEQKIK